MQKAAVVLLLFFITTSKQGFGQKASSFQWLAGNWKISTANGTIIERWSIVNDSTLAATSIFVSSANDSIPQESIELACRNGEWYYTPTVQGQNKNAAVPFKVILLKGTEFISENPVHDFPQRIAYRRIGTQLFASIEGRKNGRYGKQNFDFNSY